MSRDDQTSNLFNQGFRTHIENDLNVDFRTNNWSGMGFLKLIFPRIFALAHVKVGVWWLILVVEIMVLGIGRWDCTYQLLIRKLKFGRNFSLFIIIHTSNKVLQTRSYGHLPSLGLSRVNPLGMS